MPLFKNYRKFNLYLYYITVDQLKSKLTTIYIYKISIKIY